MSTAAIHLRRATVADLRLLQQTGVDSYRPYYQHVWHPGGVEWYIDHCFNEEVLTKELENSGIEYYFPTDTDGDILGILKVLPLQPVPDGSCDNAYYLEKIYLLPDFFGKGYGQAIIEMVKKHAATLGREVIWLQVMHNPGPIGAYAQAGFRITGPTRFEHALLLEEEQDGWVMTIAL